MLVKCQRTVQQLLREALWTLVNRTDEVTYWCSVFLGDSDLWRTSPASTRISLRIWQTGKGISSYTSYSTSSWIITSEALRYGTCSQEFSQFFLPAHPHVQCVIGMSHTCLCLPSYSRYSLTDPGGMESWVGHGPQRFCLSTINRLADKSRNISSGIKTYPVVVVCPWC